jgi:DNA repair exonuclease SbcCD nuclease subunit
MRVILFSDLHGHAFKPLSKTLENGRNSRLQDAINILDEIYNACSTYNIDGVLFGGDLFHARGTLQVPTFNAVFEGIARIKTRVNFFGMLVGNHDQVTKVGDVHACYAFDSILTVMDRTQWYTFQDEDTLEYLSVYGIPYTTDKKQVVDNLKTFGSARSPHGRSICLAHLGVSGAKAGSNFVLVTEDNPTTLPFTNAGFDQIFLGHYHQPQVLASNMRYIGATHQHNWGDVDQDRGYLIYDTDTNEVEHLNFLCAPKFVKIDHGMTYDRYTVNNNFVRYVCDKPLDPAEWKKIKETITSFGARWVEQWVEPTVSRTISSEEHIFRPGMDLDDMIESFVEGSDIDLDQNTLVELGKEILRGVQ